MRWWTRWRDRLKLEEKLRRDRERKESQERRYKVVEGRVRRMEDQLVLRLQTEAGKKQ